MTKSGDAITTDLGIDITASDFPIPGERRVEYRRPVELAGVCEFDAPYRRIDCTVVDISSAGAQLGFSSTDAVPNKFRLHILPMNTILECQVVWRQETKLGVSYVISTNCKAP